MNMDSRLLLQMKKQILEEKANLVTHRSEETHQTRSSRHVDCSSHRLSVIISVVISQILVDDIEFLNNLLIWTLVNCKFFSFLISIFLQCLVLRHEKKPTCENQEEGASFSKNLYFLTERIILCLDKIVSVNSNFDSKICSRSQTLTVYKRSFQCCIQNSQSPLLALFELLNAVGIDL